MLVYVSFFICPPSKQEESKCVNLRQTVLVCQGLVSLPDPHVRSLDMVTWPCRCQTDPPKSVSTEIRTWQGCGMAKAPLCFCRGPARCRGESLKKFANSMQTLNLPALLGYRFIFDKNCVIPFFFKEVATILKCGQSWRQTLSRNYPWWTHVPVDQDQKHQTKWTLWEIKNCIAPMDARRGRWFNFKGMKRVWGIISQFSYIGSSYPQLYLLIISFSKAFPDIYLLLISSLIFLIKSLFCYIHCLSSRLQEKNCVRRCLSSSSQQF